MAELWLTHWAGVVVGGDKITLASDKELADVLSHMHAQRDRALIGLTRLRQCALEERAILALG